MKRFTSLFAFIAFGNIWRILALSSATASGLESIVPSFDAYRDVRFLLMTRENRNPFQLGFRDLTSIQQSFFNPSKPTRILLHAWQGDGVDGLTIQTADELLDYYDFNVIYVDYTAGMSINYVISRGRVPAIGNFVASYLDFLHEHRYITFDRLTIIGFSLGAQIAGMTGKNVQRGRVNTIIGLDPAAGLFSVNTPSERLAVGDADYVEVVHTNGGFSGAGIGIPIGNADFFANGGTSQPGCLTNTCSHMRAVEYYMESIISSNFWANRCANENDAGRGRCNLEPGAFMGGEPSNFRNTLRGIFHFETNRSSPFARRH